MNKAERNKAEQRQGALDARWCGRPIPPRNARKHYMIGYKEEWREVAKELARGRK